MKTEVITLKRLKKDGSIDPSISDSVAEALTCGKLVLMPVDCIYGCVSAEEHSLRAFMKHNAGGNRQTIVRILSSFKMLDEIVSIGKSDFDFLHRIWPGEITVYLRNTIQGGSPVPVRMPRSRCTQDIIERAGVPLFFAQLVDPGMKIVYRKKEMIRAFDGKIDRMLLIDELCREHTPPSVVDISNGSLEILEEGRVPADEIKSLYFLGKGDMVL